MWNSPQEKAGVGGEKRRDEGGGGSIVQKWCSNRVNLGRWCCEWEKQKKKNVSGAAAEKDRSESGKGASKQVRGAFLIQGPMKAVQNLQKAFKVSIGNWVCERQGGDERKDC